MNSIDYKYSNFIQRARKLSGPDLEKNAERLISDIELDVDMKDYDARSLVACNMCGMVPSVRLQVFTGYYNESLGDLIGTAIDKDAGSCLMIDTIKSAIGLAFADALGKTSESNKHAIDIFCIKYKIRLLGKTKK